VLTRVTDGRGGVAREVRAATSLMSDLAAPVTARGPWLTAALNAAPSGPLARVRPRAVVVESTGPDAVALLALRRRGTTTAVTLLGAEPGPLPEGRPPARLLARDAESAAHLATGLADQLETLRGPWTLRLAGLPLGDPTLGRLVALMPDAQLSTSRSRRLVDELDTVADVRRTVDPAEVERELPAVLARVPAHQRVAVRAAARLHAAIGQLELAVVPDPATGRPAAALLTLLDAGPAGVDRWPWWGNSDVGGLRRELGSPSVTLTASAGLVRLGRRSTVRDPQVRGTAAG
jgi:hypothetical protein